MPKLKTIKQPDIDKLIRSLESTYSKVTANNDTHNMPAMYNDSFRLGQCLATIKYTIKQLKGEWPIL